jgi:hypothetical protein
LIESDTLVKLENVLRNKILGKNKKRGCCNRPAQRDSVFQSRFSCIQKSFEPMYSLPVELAHRHSQWSKQQKRQWGEGSRSHDEEAAEGGVAWEREV